MFVTAFLLGLFGSAGHCVGMCSGVTLVLARSGVVRGWRLLLAHVGRVLSYGLLGGLAGSMGLVMGQMTHGAGHVHGAEQGVGVWNVVQGGLALLAAGMAVYMGLALIGRLPSPELYLTKLTRWWRRGMGAVGNGRFSHFTPLVAGLLWGLLPCGLVLTALLTAVVAATPLQGALVMLIFGVGTWPMLFAVGWLAQAKRPAPQAWLRSVAATIVCLFGVQLALRGLAAWGWVSHMHVGQVMLW